MMHLQPRVALLVTLAAFLQLSLTIAGTQECSQRSQGLPTLSASSIEASITAQCPSLTTDPTSDCVVDLSDSSFTSTCKNAGGELYDLDYIITCPSSAADGTQKFTVNNFIYCVATICTIDDMKSRLENSKESFESSFGDGCSVETYSIVSGSKVIRVSTTLIGAMTAGLLFLVDVL